MITPHKKVLNFVTSSGDAGVRLDLYLREKCPDLSRSQVKRLISESKITVNGSAAKASHLLKKNEKITVEIPPPESLEIEPEEIPLKILFEDSDLLVLDKSAEMVVHPGAGNKRHTLVHAVLNHCKDLSGIGGKLRPGIVHRLDKGTSGVLLVAKNDFCHLALTDQFQSREVEKVYHAFIWGKPQRSRGKIDRPLGRNPRHRKKISSFSTRVRSAVTEYELEKSWGMISRLSIRPQTGRTHQIRVHFAEMGHPVVGDPTYGRGFRRLDVLPENLREVIKGFPFQLLHASRLSFRHPRTNRVVHFKAPMRKEMIQFEKMLERWKGEK